MRASSATSTVGRSDAGSACAILPPIVPRFLTAGSPTSAAASASAGAACAQIRRRGQLGMRRERADADRIPLPRDAAQFRDPSDIDERGRRRQAQLQQRHEAVAAGEELRAGMRGEELMRVRDGPCPVVVEALCIHGATRLSLPSRPSRARRAPASAASEASRRRRAAGRRSPRCTPLPSKRSSPPHLCPSRRADGAATA